MNRFQHIFSRWMAPVWFFIVVVVPATAKSESRKANAPAPFGIAAPNIQNVLTTPADFQNDNTPNAANQLARTRQQLSPGQLAQELEIKYAIGMAALRMKNWPRAIMAFENIQEADQKFRDVGKRLAQARRGLSRESQEAVVALYYGEGVSAMSQNDFGRALAAFEKTGQLEPNYRDVDSLVTAIETILQQKTATAAIALPGAPPDSSSLPKAASDGTHAASTSGRIFFYAGGAFAGLIVLFALSMIGFSPATRARLHLLRGNPAAAAQIYEQLLHRHPERVKFYLPLANIYLNLGKRDERAMRVYKSILYLNLATRNREEINSIVAQKYLTEGRTDSDAIAVLEDALKTERRKQG